VVPKLGGAYKNNLKKDCLKIRQAELAFIVVGCICNETDSHTLIF
jgi:hypothetical protein